MLENCEIEINFWKWNAATVYMWRKMEWRILSDVPWWRELWRQCMVCSHTVIVIHNITLKINTKTYYAMQNCFFFNILRVSVITVTAQSAFTPVIQFLKGFKEFWHEYKIDFMILLIHLNHINFTCSRYNQIMETVAWEWYRFSKSGS